MTNEARQEHGDQLGHVNIDGSAPDDASAGAIVVAAQRNTFRRDVYVGIRDHDQGIDFLGRVVSGPYHGPDEQGATSDKTQAIVETPAHVVGFRSGGFLAGDFDFVLHDLASHPLAADLGLEVGTTPVSLAFWMKYSR